MTSPYTPPKLQADWFPKGFRGAGLICGIKKSGKRDLALIVSDEPSIGAGMFTQNNFAAAPVVLSRPVAEQGDIRAIVCNSGIANACTGEQGIKNAQRMQDLTAKALNLKNENIIVCSTGVIGTQLPMEAIESGIQQAAENLDANAWEEVIDAIRTTDAFPKTYGEIFEIGGKEIRMLGLAKGGGMIHPNMATMLSFIVTDCAIELDALQTALKPAIETSFNSISVDGDTSTNDTVILMANGAAGNEPIKLGTPEYDVFCEKLNTVSLECAKLIVRDGEGTTRLGILKISGAINNDDAKKAAVAVAKSPLVKTALYGADPNWGRIVCAIGYSGAQVNPEQTSVKLAGQLIFQAGLSTAIDEARAKSGMEESEVEIVIDLGTGGNGKSTYYTSDLTHDYIQLNAFYRT